MLQKSHNNFKPVFLTLGINIGGDIKSSWVCGLLKMKVKLLAERADGSENRGLRDILIPALMAGKGPPNPTNTDYTDP